MKRRGWLVGVSVLAVTGASLTGSLPAVAAPVSAMNQVFTPPASTDQHAIPAINAPTIPWLPLPGSVIGTNKSQANTTSALRPQTAPAGTTVGAPGLGSLPYFGFDKTELSLDLVAQVNLGNGNLLLTDSDSVQTGPGESIRADRFYNGLATSAGSFGGGWSSAVSQMDFGLQVSSTTAVFHGPSGIAATFTQSGSTYTAPMGLNATLTQNTASTDARYVMTYNRTGEKLSFNPSGWLTSDVDKNGVGNHYSYDSSNRIHYVTGDSGRQLTVNWSGSGQIASMDDSAGRHWQYDTTNGALSRVGKPGNLTEQYTYDTSGRVASIQTSGAQGSDTLITFGYDGSSRITSLQIAAASTPTTIVAKTTYAYSSGQTILTDGNGHATTYAIDSQGRVLSATDALGHKKSSTYTSNSDVQTTTDALGSGQTPGNQTTYGYDSLNNLSTVSLPTGAAASAAYAVGGNCPNAGAGNPYLPKCSKDDAGNGVSYSYDSSGNPTTIKDSTTNGTGVTPFTYTYDKADHSVCGGFAGQICSVKNGNGNTTTYNYDSHGNLTKITRPAPLGVVNITSYDAAGRATSVTDGKGQTTQYEYNVRDKIVKTTFQSGSTVQQSYYNNGTAQTATDSVGGVTQTFTYDPAGRQLAQQGPSSSTASYVYDSVGNITSYQDQYGTTGYGYDNVNELTSIITPGGSCPASGNPANSGCIKIGYNANGAETSRSLPAGASIATTIDVSGRTTRVTAKNSGGTVVADIGYSYAATATAGTGSSADRTSIQSRVSYLEQGVTVGATTGYIYDALGRLTSATEKAGTSTTASWVYGYDADGNRTSQTRSGSTGSTSGSLTYGYNAADELTSASGSGTPWTYDENGDQTQNGLTGQSQTVNDRLAVTGIGATSYANFLGGNGTPLTRGSSSYGSSALGITGESTGNTPTEFIRTPTGDPAAEKQGGGLYYFVRDSLGSVIGLIDSSGAWSGGYSYSPYGETRSITNSAIVAGNALRFAGGYLDTANGLYRFGARFYDSTIGRFTQADPSGQGKNVYAYTDSDPVNAVDLSGLVSAKKKARAQLAGQAVDAAIAITGVALAAAITLGSGGFAFPVAGLIVGGTFAALGGGIGAGIASQGAGHSKRRVRNDFIIGGIEGGLGNFASPPVE